VRCFGIRHHGPGSARSVVRALEEFAPDVVLLEAPADTAEALLFVARDDLVPPVALLGYALDDPRRASFSPLASFSPEWVTLKWAARHGVPVRPMDLPIAATLAMRDVRRNDEPRGWADPIAMLAAAAGDDDPERWWDDVVEHRGNPDEPDPFAAVGEAMAAVRTAVSSEGWVLSDSEAAREAMMRQTLRQAIADAFRRIAVVCGAWHVPALAPDTSTVDIDLALVHGCARTKVAITWVPWTHRRLAAATGYGAGVESPGWYAHIHQHGGTDSISRWFARVARLLRAKEMLVSPDHVIGATRLAGALAGLRSRPVAGLAEVTDAAHSVLGDGRAGPMALIHDHLVVGDEIGSVPADTPMVPLARDLAAEAKRTRLKPEAHERTLELDLRLPRDLGRSQLLHQLWLLEVPWGRPEEGRRSVGTFRETWRLRWEPELELRLIDASALGTTVAAATANRVRERAAAADTLPALTALVELALRAALDDTVDELMERVAAQAAAEADVEHLMDALGPLARALRYGDVRATAAAPLRAVIDGLVDRVGAGLVPACSALDDDGAAAMAGRLTATQTVLALIDHPSRHTAWPRVLNRIADLGSVHGTVRGAAARLLLDAGVWSADAAARRLSRALTPGTAPAAGAAYVEGFLGGSGTVIIHDATLLKLVDTWLTSLPTDAFTTALPLLRRTFGAFEPAERRRIGELVAGHGDGRGPAAFGWDLDPSRVAAGVATVRTLLGVDEGRLG
jgi:hypothetical protein